MGVAGHNKWERAPIWSGGGGVTVPPQRAHMGCCAPSKRVCVHRDGNPCTSHEVCKLGRGGRYTPKEA